eukprot:TRINITY_DN4342_c0_g1_i2.p1 TRINITY_DN4342_c0_g1~~TRINITY_DN4342_c0_g1_i2.p1  ORF type:complete len:193 (-),score=35.10 TRINITY_DN4342_c0_g1_i2:672-1250(-)
MATPPATSTAVVTRQTIICQDCELVGNIVVGEGSVLHPKCSLVAEDPNGKIQIGENCIIEELVSIVHKGSGTLKIGNNNLFEVGCKIEGVKEIGDENVFEPKCEVRGDITVGSGCTISAATVVNGETQILDNTTIWRQRIVENEKTIQDTNKITSSKHSHSREAHMAIHTRHLESLWKTLVNFHHLRKPDVS